MRDRGWLSISYPAGAFSGPYIHDILACCDGRFVTVEVKTEGDRLIGPRWDGQLRFAERVRLAGGISVIPAYSTREAIEAIEKELYHDRHS